MNVDDWLKNNHTLVELAPKSCAKLVYIYGPEINLYCGDATKLSLAQEEESGILFFDGKEWKPNEVVNELLKKKIVRNLIKFLDFIFENHENIDRLKALQNKLANVN